MWIIEDEVHAEPQGEFESFDSTLAELQRRARIPWDVAPNVASSVVEFSTVESPWRETQRLHVLDVSADGMKWVRPFDSTAPA